MSKYQPVIGLEIHVELATKSKMFCQCEADWFGKAPNTNTCPVCLGLPGALPVPNQKAIEWTIMIAQALNCRINTVSKFDRKHYFYPDLPKGYQISQYDEPIGIKGFIEVNGKRFGVTRVHLEEDTGKLIHKGVDTLVDFNRSGVPLVEIVTEPDFTSSEDAKRFLEELHTIMRYLDVSDANMEQGSMRLEPNISLRVLDSASLHSNNKYSSSQVEKLPSYKVEVKNINSFNFVKQAIDYEVKRQSEIISKGETPIQEARGYNETKKITFSQRSKEEAHDYRYFPEPDIPPLEFNEEYIQQIKHSIPILPQQKVEVYVNKGVQPEAAFILSRNSGASIAFEQISSALKQEYGFDKPEPGTASLIINKKIDYINLPIETSIEKAYELLKPKETDMAKLDDLIKHLIKSNPKAVTDYKAGKENALMFLVGQVMKELKGQADATTVKKALEEKLKQS